MSEGHFGFTLIVAVWTALALAPLVGWQLGLDYFGRTGGQPAGPRLPARWGWFLMELPALIVLPAMYLVGGERQAVGDILVGLWTAHYAHRTLLWPWLVQRNGRAMPVATCLAGFAFNVVNGLLFGWFLTRLAAYPSDWTGDIRFIAGAAVMLLGASLNIWSDYHLARLRRDSPGKPVLPHRGAFRFVSCPNLAGEIMEWAGFALMSWSLPGLSFAIWTAANLIPRARWRRRWYRQQFENYPESRRALIPKIL